MNETKFKPGDKVRVKGDLVVGNEYSMEKNYASDSFTSGMLALLGKEVTIKGSGTRGYEVKEDLGGWNWTDEMFEEIVPEYVEAVQSLTGIEKGKIYPYLSNRVIDGKYNNYSLHKSEGYRYFKPSTKEAFEAQNKPKYIKYIDRTEGYRIKDRIYEVVSWKSGNVWVECNLECSGIKNGNGMCMDSLFTSPERYSIATEEDYINQVKPKLEVGKWYKYSGWYIKYLKSVDGAFKSSEYITDSGRYSKSQSSFGYNDSEKVLLTDLSEIQEFLPDGHNDSKMYLP